MKPQVPDPQPTELDLEKSIENLKKINLKLSRVLRKLEEERRTEKKNQQH